MSSSCAVGDYDNDERPDIAVDDGERRAALHNDGEGAFTPAPREAGLPARSAGPSLGVTFVDFDHDADLDLIVAGAATAVFRNNGNGTFADVTGERGFALPNTRAITASDLNNDRAIDLIVTGDRTAVLINPREGAFTPLTAFTPSAPADTRGVAVVDFDKDGWMDLVFTHGAAPGLSLWRNVVGHVVRAGRICRRQRSSSGAGLAVVDYDNDGWLDIVATGTDCAEPSGDCRAAKRAGPLRGCDEDRRRERGGRAEAAARAARRRSRQRLRRRSGRRPTPADLPSCCATTAATRTRRSVWRWPA